MIQDLINSLSKTPDPIILENLPDPRIYLLHEAFMRIEICWRSAQGVPYPPRYPEPFEIPPVILKRLEKSYSVLPKAVFDRCVRTFIKLILEFPQDRNSLFDGLATALEPTRYLDRFGDSLETSPEGHCQEKTNHQDNPGREITRQPIANPSPKKQPTPTNPDLKNLPTYALVKHYALVRKTTVFDFILEQSGSLNFSKVHDFIQHKNNFKLSSRGKVVYDGSFAWIARELRISMRTVWGAFHWMAQRKLVTKIAPQDHLKKKNSRWYVCTSMAQNLKLWSLAYQDKKG